MKATTLVIGGTGKTGKRVAARLAAKGHGVRVASRTGAVQFTWEDQSTWGPALRGCDSAYIAYAPDLAVPGSEAHIKALVAAAEREGLQKLVLLSGRGEPEAQRCEDIVRAGSIPWTVLRASWFAQNFSEGTFADDLRRGVLMLPAGNVPEPFIDIEDIAEIAEEALLTSKHANKLYELSGPRAITFAEAVNEISQGTGHPARFESVDIETFAGFMKEAPQEVIGLLRYLFTHVLDGRNAKPADGVMQALGRPARDFKEFVRASADSWR